MIKNLDAHHVIGRNTYKHRYNLNNGMALCKGCHMYSREHSPHYDIVSCDGFKDKFKKLKNPFKEDIRYQWYEDNKHDKSQPKEKAQYHYYKLLDVYISMLDGVQMWPNEEEVI